MNPKSRWRFSIRQGSTIPPQTVIPTSRWLQAEHGWLFISGQGGETEDGQLSKDFHEQVRQAVDNLLIAIAAAGGQPSQVAKLTVLIVDHNEQRLGILGEELARAFGAQMKPACTLIPVPRLALDGMLFEVDAVVVLPEA